jgi:hypothetical protein
MSSLPYDQRYDIVIDHIDGLLAQAEDERRVLLIRPVPFPRASMGTLLIAFGRALIWAGERVGG